MGEVGDGSELSGGVADGVGEVVGLLLQRVLVEISPAQLVHHATTQRTNDGPRHGSKPQWARTDASAEMKRKGVKYPAGSSAVQFTEPVSQLGKECLQTLVKTGSLWEIFKMWDFEMAANAWQG